MVFTWVDFETSSYGEYQFPAWAEVVGWMMSMTSVMAIPAFIAWKVCTSDQEDTLWEVRCACIVYIYLCQLSASSLSMVAADAVFYEFSPLISVFTCTVYFYVCHFSPLTKVVHVADSGSSSFSLYIYMYNVI